VSSDDVPLHRSYLYAPGTRPDLMRKALRAGADAVVLDLEDAVVPARRPEAREAISALLAEVVGDGGAPSVMVRVARGAEGYLAEDLEAAVRPGLHGLRLPKAESVAEIRAVADRVDELERERGMPSGGVRLDVTVETARGALGIGDLLLASPRVVRAGLGAADLLADLGAEGDDDLATLHVRSHLVLVSRAVGAAPPIDSVHTAIDDDEGLLRSARRARALGFLGKSVIHPRQIGPVHVAFTPSEAELEAARGILAAHAEADAEGSAALVVDGRFVDPAIVARARATLRIGARP
jgi:citrate lyase subunit beta/citryl-CoA lyase